MLGGLFIMASEETIIVDVRGEVCPVPLIKSMEAMKIASIDQTIELFTDFKPAVFVVMNAAMNQGWDVAIKQQASTEWKLLLSKVNFV
jgi:TusA-related sulfurtransferase